MAHAVIATFDPAAEHQVRALWAVLANNDIDSSMTALGVAPHLTLAVYDDAMEGPLIGRVSDFGARTAPFGIAFDRIDMFEGRESVLFLAPQASPRLRKLHEGFHDHAFGTGTCHDHYRPGAWVPHATLAMAMRKKQVRRAADLFDGTFETIAARLVGLQIVRFRPAVRFESVAVVHRAPFGGKVATG